jgi:hypothetical protein
MIPKEIEQTLDTVGTVHTVAKFRITDDTLPRILVDLSDKMYENKELAVVREYSTNAADAMTKAGKPLSDIIVTLPTFEDATFKIRDFGEGLSEQKISDVYCVLGASDKRNSNAYNGMFGYGCKAGFAHADSFFVTSWCEGLKTVYQCIKGDTRTPHQAIRLSRVSTDEPTGIEISVPVKNSSVYTFQQVASDFYRFWDVLPTLQKMDQTYFNRITEWKKQIPSLKGEGWEIYPNTGVGSSRGVVYMGYVAYPIQWSIFYNKMSLTEEKRILFDLLSNNHLVLYCNIGEVSFTNSRESLEYTEDTFNFLMKKIESIFGKIVDTIQDKFSGADSLWEAKKLYGSIFGRRDLGDSENHPNDDGRIRFLTGDLSKFERTYGSKFTWNNISIGSPYFKKINRFDNALADIQDDSYDPSHPVMVTFRKKNKRVKLNKCNASGNNHITASVHTAVVINDTGHKTGIQQVARYLTFKENSKVIIVHVLTFGSKALKKKFFDEYNFHTVPALELSDISVDAKAWSVANREVCSSGGGGTRMMKYIDIKTKFVDESEVPIREIEEGYYIRAGIGSWRGGIRVINALGNPIHPRDIVEYVKTANDYLGLDIDKVYIINNQTFESKWFTAAVEDESWVGVWDYLKENLEGLDFADLTYADTFHSEEFVSVEIGNKIRGLLKNPESLFIKMVDITNKNVSDKTKDFIGSVKGLGFWTQLTKNVKIDKSFTNTRNDVIKTYPLLIPAFGWRLKSQLEKEEVNHAANYINAIDSYKETNSPAKIA